MSLSVLRRTAPKAEEADTLAPLRERVEALASRSRAVAERSTAIDAREAAARAELDAAVRDGRDADGPAAQVAGIPGERLALVAQSRAIEGALAEARAALEAEETRLRELELDAEEAHLRGVEEAAEEALRLAIIAAGTALEELHAAAGSLRSFCTRTGRPDRRGFLTGEARAFEAAREAARQRARAAVERGADGSSSSSESSALPYALVRRRRVA